MITEPARYLIDHDVSRNFSKKENFKENPVVPSSKDKIKKQVTSKGKPANEKKHPKEKVTNYKSYTGM